MAFSFEQHRPTRALIHLDHLRHNLRILREANALGAFFCPMVKANAYGHGDFEVARILESEGVASMGVGLVEEGAVLRGLGIKADLLSFGLFDARGARDCLDADLIPVLSSWDQIQALISVLKSEARVRVHLKFDTGMHRLGFEPDEMNLLFDFFQQNPHFRLEGVMTHLQAGEDANLSDGQSFRQLHLLQALGRPFQKWTRNVHALNSAGLLNLSKLRQNGFQEVNGVSLNWGARPGIALYGASPLSEDFSLKPVMSLRSKIVRLKEVATGSGVSYGPSWRAVRPSWIGIVPIGYADGYRRFLSNRAEVLIDGRRAKVVGTVCMDYVMVDLTDLVGADSPTPFLWKEVTLFGYDAGGALLHPNELAQWAQTISYEIFTGISERVPRVSQERGE